MANVPTSEEIEARKASRSLRFAIVYSGQVCHGRGADVLWHPANMEKLWRNQVEMLHDPLRAWGEVHVFGLFEESSPPASRTPSNKDKNKAAGCNDFARLANWTGLEFMPSEVGRQKRDRVVNHGEERRAMAMVHFILGDPNSDKWKSYDFVMNTRPDAVFRKPVTEWGVDFTKINTPHFESNGPRECDPAKLATTPGAPPAMGDAFVMYPKRWIPIMLALQSAVMGRTGLQAALGKKCPCCKADLATPSPPKGPGAGTSAAPPVLGQAGYGKGVHVLDTAACHNTRSCLWHPLYYLYGERFCGEKLRPGESPGEFCLPGSAADMSSLKACGLLAKGASAQEAKLWIPWNQKHYQPYEGPMELAPCMNESVTGWLCPSRLAGATPPAPPKLPAGSGGNGGSGGGGGPGKDVEAARANKLRIKEEAAAKVVADKAAAAAAHPPQGAGGGVDAGGAGSENATVTKHHQHHHPLPVEHNHHLGEKVFAKKHPETGGGKSENSLAELEADTTGLLPGQKRRCNAQTGKCWVFAEGRRALT